MAATIDIEEIKNLKHIKYICSRHGEIVQPIKSIFYSSDSNKKIIPHFDVYCPLCISELYDKLSENGEIGNIHYEAEYKEGFTPKPKKKAGEISE